MKYEIVTKNEFMVVGIECHLNLADESASTKIGNHWNKFFAEKMTAKIENISQPMTTIGIYKSYDRAGNYILVIGCLVNSLDSIPVGMKGYTIPTTKYALFKIPNKTPKSVADFWQELWRHKDTLGLQRAFTHDFELYNPDKTEVDVYISIL